MLVIHRGALRKISTIIIFIHSYRIISRIRVRPRVELKQQHWH